MNTETSVLPYLFHLACRKVYKNSCQDKDLVFFLWTSAIPFPARADTSPYIDSFASNHSDFQSFSSLETWPMTRGFYIRWRISVQINECLSIHLQYKDISRVSFYSNINSLPSWNLKITLFKNKVNLCICACKQQKKYYISQNIQMENRGPFKITSYVKPCRFCHQIGCSSKHYSDSVAPAFNQEGMFQCKK